MSKGVCERKVEQGKQGRKGKLGCGGEAAGMAACDTVELKRKLRAFNFGDSAPWVYIVGELAAGFLSLCGRERGFGLHRYRPSTVPGTVTSSHGLPGPTMLSLRRL